ncbi:MAG: DUF2892 domain-containing protein [Candidatus Neomarinimicrobiota bacterium]
MTSNMGAIDRIIRVVLAVIFIYLILEGTLTGVWAWVLGILGIIFLLTSLASFCPVYKLLGVSTLKKAQGGEST